MVSPVGKITRLSLHLVLAALLLGACGSPAPPSTTLETPRRIILITVDTLRADHLGIYGYPRDTSPNLDRLAGQGVLFGRAIAQWPKTTPSFASIFTGQYPHTRGMTHRAAKWLAEDHHTLAETMRAAGFWTGAVVSNPVLSGELGWDQGFDEYIETWHIDEYLSADPVRFRSMVNALQVNELAMPLLESAASRDRVFLWLHYSDPHAPYILPPGIANPFVGDEFDVQDEIVEPISPAVRIGGHDRLGFYVAQYDANIRVADRLIGELLAKAAELDLLDDALVVFTSDHGEALGEHQDYFHHGAFAYNTESHVPLIFLFDGGAVRGGRVELPVELIDLYPTLTDLLAVESPAELEGKSLVPLLAGSATGADFDPRDFAYAFTEAGKPMVLRSYYRSVQDPRWKLIFHPPVHHRRKGQAPALIELYDLERDPLEQANLAGQHEADFNRLWGELTTWMAQGRAEADEVDEAAGHSEETLEALRALGYVD